MAKAKKQAPPTSTPAPAPTPAPAEEKKPAVAAAPKKAGAKGGTGAKKSAKAAAAPAPAAPAVPMIDTNLAAAAAAKMLVHKESASAGGGNPAASGRESAAFKQLKENLHKPVGPNAPSFLQSLNPGKKLNTQPGSPGHFGTQQGRNQTFGADVNRSGVPRRTGG